MKRDMELIRSILLEVDSNWKRAMQVVVQKGGSATLEILAELLKSMMRSTLGLG